MSFDTERFIEEIKKRECLWNTGIKAYADRELKKKCWDEVVDLFKENDDLEIHEKKQLTDTLQKRWKSIRGCYSREINRQRKSGSSASRKSEYIHFKQLQFLQNVVAVREPSPAADPGAEAGSAIAEEAGSESDEDEDMSEMRYQKSKRVQKRKIIELLAKSIEKQDENEKDGDRSFLLSLVDTLKKVPVHRKVGCKIKMLTLIDKEISDSDV